jgi:hypothetical protein
MLAGKGRTYRYYKGKPLFPFGFGLSYTRFNYSDLKVLGDFMKGEPVDVSFVVENVGDLAGDEVLQVYVSAIGVPGEPIKALKWFKRRQFEVDQKITVVARLENEAFMIYDEEKDDMVLRPGKFRIAVGGSSDDKDLIATEVTFAGGDKNESRVRWTSGGSIGLAGLFAIILGAVVIVLVMILVILGINGKEVARRNRELLNSGRLLVHNRY